MFKRSFVRDPGNWMIILELFLASTGSSVITGCRIVTDLLRLDCPGGGLKGRGGSPAEGLRDLDPRTINCTRVSRGGAAGRVK